MLTSSISYDNIIGIDRDDSVLKQKTIIINIP